MGCTLISFIGTGHKESGGYAKTVYRFPDGDLQKTNVFMEAVLNSGYRPVNRLVLIGTKGSSWDMLVEGEEELWLTVGTQAQEGGVMDETFLEIEKYLSQTFGIPVKIICHDVIKEDTAASIFDKYSEIVSGLKGDDVLFDITHSFRSMPLLMYQALQFSAANNGIRSVELVYGEYLGGGAMSHARDLSTYWRYAQITDALSVFDTKLDGGRLASLVESVWPEGAAVLQNITKIAQTNFALDAEKAIRTACNVIKKYPSNAPKWLGGIKSKIAEYADLLGRTRAHTLKNYSQYLFRHQLSTQAVIALQVAVETAIALKYGYEDSIGDYKWWQNNGREHLNELKRGNFTMLQELSDLEGMRNRIAHGGGKNKYLNKNKKAMSIEQIYKNAIEGVDALLDMADL